MLVYTPTSLRTWHPSAYQYERQLKVRKEQMAQELAEIEAKESEERNKYYVTQLNDMTQDALKSVDLPVNKALHTEFLAFAMPYVRHNDDVTYEELEVLADRFKEVISSCLQHGHTKVVQKRVMRRKKLDSPVVAMLIQKLGERIRVHYVPVHPLLDVVVVHVNKINHGEESNRSA